MNAGTDCTEEFEAIHSDAATELLQSYLIGYVAQNETLPSNELTTKDDTNQNMVTLDRKSKVSLALINKIAINHDSYLFRFELPSDKHILGLPVGQHVFFYANIDRKTVIRAYTPSSSNNAKGIVDFVIKIYRKDTHQRYPQVRIILFSNCLNGLTL